MEKTQINVRRLKPKTARNPFLDLVKDKSRVELNIIMHDIACYEQTGLMRPRLFALIDQVVESRAEAA